jgi:hypothetical protein
MVNCHTELPSAVAVALSVGVDIRKSWGFVEEAVSSRSVELGIGGSVVPTGTVKDC